MISVGSSLIKVFFKAIKNYIDKNLKSLERAVTKLGGRLIMKKSITLNYGSEYNEIDANTLIVSLMSISEAVTDINRYLNNANGTENTINIRISAVTKGSINFEILLVQNIGHALMALLGTPSSLPQIISFLADMISIISFLASKKPKSIKKKDNGTVLVENQFNDCKEITLNTYNVYMNCPRAREALAKNNEVVSDDLSLSGFKILDNGTPVVSLTHEEMSKAQESLPLSDTDHERDTFENVSLKATKISYNPTHKWSFIMRGIAINAKVEDAAFLRRVDANEMFSKGDWFEVKLRITQVWDESVNAWLNKSYTVVEVISHQTPEPELSLDI